MSCNINIWQVISNDKTLSILTKLIKKVGLEDFVASLKNSTFFTPTDVAFAGNASLTDYLFDPTTPESTVKNVIYYFITGKPYTTAQLVPAVNLVMLDGRILVSLRSLYYPFMPILTDQVNNNANITDANLSTADNNYIQKVNNILQYGYIPYPIIINPYTQQPI